MAVKERDTRQWSGLGKVVGVIIVLNQLLSMTSLGVSGTYATNLGQAPIDFAKLSDNGHVSWSSWGFGQFFAFAALIPAITLIWATLDLVLHILGGFHPIYAAPRLLIGLVGWVIQEGLWIDCNLIKSTPSTAPTELCFQSYAMHDSAGRIVGIEPSLASATVAVGMLVLLLHLALFVLAVVALIKWIRHRRGRYSSVSRMDNVDTSYRSQPRRL